jgi:hypothetical protein
MRWIEVCVMVLDMYMFEYLLAVSWSLSCSTFLGSEELMTPTVLEIAFFDVNFGLVVSTEDPKNLSHHS